MDEPERLQQEITQIGDRYLRRTLGELPRLRELIAGLRSQMVRSSGTALIDEIQRLAHRINGSGAMFGFEAVSTRARELELLAESRAGDEEFVRRLEACVSSLEEQVRADARGRGIA